jgi:hypothetical protein
LPAGQAGRKTKSPIEFALDQWHGNEFNAVAGEGADKYSSLFFRDETALDGEFETVAQAVFQPLLAQREVAEE